MPNYNYVHGEFKRDLAFTDYSQISKIADRVLKERNIEPPDKDSYPYRKLCRELLKQHLRIIEILKQRELGDYSEDTKPVQIVPMEQPEKISEKLSTIVKAYWDENSSRWKPRSQTHYEGIENWLLCGS